MWLLTTRGRQKEAQRLLDACAETMTQKAICYVDGDTYPGLKLPPNWTLVEREENIGVGPAMNWFYEKHPYLQFYGWLADDFVPKDLGWDIALSDAAAHDGIAYCNDGWKVRNGRGPFGSMANPNWLTSAFAIGGDLVRAVGWFSPPGLRQAGIDSAWNRIGRRFGLMRFNPGILVEHLHYKNGKRPRDMIDNDAAKEKPLWHEYLNTQEVSVMTRVKEFLDADRTR